MIALCAGIIGFYGVVFLFSRIVLRMQVSMSALAALTASAPAVPFVGPAVLGDLFGGLSAIPIALGGLVINLTVVPITILLLALNSTGREPTESLLPPAQGGEQSESSPKVVPFRYSLPNSWKLSKNRSYGHLLLLSLSCSLVFTFLKSSSTRFPCWARHPEASRSLLWDGACTSGKIKVTWQILFFVFLKNVHTANSRARWFAMARLWQSRRERGGSYDGDSDHADCDQLCSEVSHRAGGGRFRRVLQHDGLGRSDGGFHRPPNTIDERPHGIEKGGLK